MNMELIPSIKNTEIERPKRCRSILSPNPREVKVAVDDNTAMVAIGFPRGWSPPSPPGPEGALFYLLERWDELELKQLLLAYAYALTRGSMGFPRRGRGGGRITAPPSGAGGTPSPHSLRSPAGGCVGCHRHRSSPAS